MAALAAACGPSNDLVIYVLAYTGLRWGELAGLRVQDVLLERRRLVVARSVTEINGRAGVGTPKSHHRRQVPFPSFLAEPLRRHIAGRTPDPLLFTSPEGGVLRNSNLRRRSFDRAATVAGVPGLSWADPT